MIHAPVKSVATTVPVFAHRIRLLVASVFMLAAVIGLVFHYPFNMLPKNYLIIFALFRSIFFSLVICRLWFGRWALPMLWGYSAKQYLKPIWVLWLWVAIAGALGIGGSIPAYLNMVLFLIVFYRSKYYSIEDIYYQLVTLILLFLPITSAYSVDALFGWDKFDLAAHSPAVILGVLNLYAWLLALMLISAALEKSLTENWRKGLSFYYFVALPHLVLSPWRWIKHHKWLCQIASWMTVLGQGSLFIGYFIPALLPLFWFKQCVFGLLLICIVDLSYIGQIFIAQFTFFLILTNGAASDHAVNIESIESYFVTGASVILLLLAGLRSFFMEQKSYATWMPSIADKIVRLATGSCPIKVFSDAHLFGLYLYQLIDDEGRNVVPVFNDKGEAGPFQRWHPRYYQGAMYSVTDACLAKRYSSNYSGDREDRLDDLIAVAIQRANTTSKIILRVKAINPSDEYERDTRHWLDEYWTDIYEGRIDNGKIIGRWINLPPEVKKTARDFIR